MVCVYVANTSGREWQVCKRISTEDARTTKKKHTSSRSNCRQRHRDNSVPQEAIGETKKTMNKKAQIGTKVPLSNICVKKMEPLARAVSVMQNELYRKKRLHFFPPGRMWKLWPTLFVTAKTAKNANWHKMAPQTKRALAEEIFA